MDKEKIGDLLWHSQPILLIALAILTPIVVGAELGKEAGFSRWWHGSLLGLVILIVGFVFVDWLVVKTIPIVQQTWQEQIIQKLAGVLTLPFKPAPSGPSEPVGQDRPPQALHLPKEDWVAELEFKYGDDEYEFVEENGELRLEPLENG